MAFGHIECHKYLARLRQATQLFEYAGAVDVTSELRSGLANLASITETTSSPDEDWNIAPVDASEGALFDIPSFLDVTVGLPEATTTSNWRLTPDEQMWEQRFPDDWNAHDGLI